MRLIETKSFGDGYSEILLEPSRPLDWAEQVRLAVLLAKFPQVREFSISVSAGEVGGTVAMCSDAADLPEFERLAVKAPGGAIDLTLFLGDDRLHAVFLAEGCVSALYRVGSEAQKLAGSLFVTAERRLLG